MAKAMSIKVLGIPKVKKFLKDKDKEAIELANKAIIKSGFFIEGEVKQSIAGHKAEPKSVDTGRFLNSIKNVQNQILTSTIETNVEYARILEFGGKNRSPRHHFANTAKRNEKKVRNFVNAEVKKIS